MNVQSTATYRADIDGLRALSVIVVIAFHLGLPGFGGGFVGVDVFFVISGFLITNLIYKEYQITANFSFKNFYFRRFKRLFPAFFSTVVMTLIVGVLYFPSLFQQKTLNSALYALLGISNFHFWQDSGYFSSESITKPFLHTWSLAVEEQFYLFWPAFLILILRSKKTWALCFFITLVILLGVILNLALFHNQISFIKEPFGAGFYLLPFRIFELAIGAGLVLLQKFRLSSRFKNELLFIAGIFAIILSVKFFNDTILFPYVNALLPCVGAALIIYSGETASSARIFKFPVVLWVGLRSYSLYLVHWPIIVFAHALLNVDMLNLHTQITCAIISLVLGSIMYRFVEQPFRYGYFNSILPIRWEALSGLAYIFVFGTILLHQADYIETPKAENTIEEKTKRFQGGSFDDTVENCRGFCDYRKDKSQKFVLLSGDSHATYYTKALMEELPASIGVVSATAGGCWFGPEIVPSIKTRTEKCISIMQRTAELLDSPNLIGIIHGQRWHGYMKNNNYKMEELIRDNQLFFKHTKKPLVLLGANANFSANDCSVFGIECDPLDNSIGAVKKFEESAPGAFNYSGKLLIVHPYKTICDDQSCPKRQFFNSGFPIYFDSHHLNREGARIVLRTFLDDLLEGLN